MDATLTLSADDPLAREATTAIRTGDVEHLRSLLDAHPGLASARLTRDDAQPDATVEDLPTCTLLHVATDHPGHYPAVARTIALLVGAGAEPDAPFTGPHAETALHWAASTDDVEAVDALVRAGADLEAPGSVIDGGTALADAVAFGQWGAADHLFHAGARTNLWQAAALGLADRVGALLAAEPAPDEGDLATALWCAAHGGRHACVDLLLARGADPSWIGFDGLTAAGAARRAGHRGLADALTP